MRFDLHVHTYCSDDSLMTPAQIVRAVARSGLDGLAITDHNTIEGALQLQTVAPFPVIVGEEVETTGGEIIGLFLRAPIAPGLSLEETIAAIHEQGALVYVPHPLDRLRRAAIGRTKLQRIIDQVDALEVFNSRILFAQENTEAREIAAAYGLAMGAGSDAHAPIEIGRAYVEVQPFDGPASFLAALHQGRALGKLSSPAIHFLTSLARFRRRFSRRKC